VQDPVEDGAGGTRVCDGPQGATFRRNGAIAPLGAGPEFEKTRSVFELRREHPPATGKPRELAGWT